MNLYKFSYISLKYIFVYLQHSLWSEQCCPAHAGISAYRSIIVAVINLKFS